MDRNTADSYVFARASFLVSRTYTGVRAQKLLEARRLQDLWVLLFTGTHIGNEVPLIPEGMLALEIERKAQELALFDIFSLLKAYDSIDPVSKALLFFYDINNLKTISSALSLGLKEKQYIADLGSFSVFNYKKWNDIKLITQGTDVSWYNRVPIGQEQVEWENKLDHVYYEKLWSALLSLSKKDRLSCEELIKEEIILQNIVWVLRLKVNYRATAEEIKPLIALYGADIPRANELYEPALEILDFPTDSYEPWVRWKYRWLLNPHEEGVPWFLDPRWAQLAGDKKLYKLALRNFRKNPFTVGVLVSFFKIKQLEQYFIQVATEGLRLEVDETQMKSFMEDPQNVKNN